MNASGPCSGPSSITTGRSDLPPDGPQRFFHERRFTMKHNTHIAFGLLGATLLAAALSACAPVTRTASGEICNAAAAKALMMKDHCLTCHSLTKQKSGPTFKAVAKRYQGNPNAEADLYAHLTSDDVSKMPDGDTGYHKCIKTENPERVRNMVRWILDQ